MTSSKIETCERLQLPMHVEERLQEKHQELEQLYVQLNNQILCDDLISIKMRKLVFHHWMRMKVTKFA